MEVNAKWRHLKIDLERDFAVQAFLSQTCAVNVHSSEVSNLANYSSLFRILTNPLHVKVHGLLLITLTPPFHVRTSVPDPDPASRFHADPDPYPTFHFAADPDPDLTIYIDADPNFQIKAQNLEKVLN